MNDADYLEEEGRATGDRPHLRLLVLRMALKWVRYFTDGAVIGCKEFVNEAFAGARDCRSWDAVECQGFAGEG